MNLLFGVFIRIWTQVAFDVWFQRRNWLITWRFLKQFTLDIVFNEFFNCFFYIYQISTLKTIDIEFAILIFKFHFNLTFYI